MFKHQSHFYFVGILLNLTAASASGNVLGSDAQNFNATTSGLDFVTVHSSKTLEPGIFNLGLFVNHAVNTLPYFKESTGKTTKSKQQDALTGADINMGVGLMKNWDLGLSFPQMLHQTINNDELRGEFGNTGNTEIRVNTKVRVLGNKQSGLALVASISQNRIENNPYSGVGAGPTTTVELAVDTMVQAVALAANLGYRWRQPGEAIEEFPIVPIKNQYIASVAASYLLQSIDTKLIGEIFGSWPAEGSDSQVNTQQSSMEGLLGLKHDITRQVAVHFGAGTELQSGIASPDWRVYTGVNVTFGPLWGKEQTTITRKRTPKPKPQQQPANPPEPEQEVETVEDSASPFTNTPTAGLETITFNDINFAFDSYRDVLPGAKKTLVKLADYIQKPPVFKKLIIEGHTDSVGSAEYNQRLSEERAAKVREHLVKFLKLDGSKIQSVGYGFTRPIDDNGNYQGRQRNRRVQVLIER
jgi:outer membrane protein OmpA-like peptidoglycan-associated protein